MRPEVPIECACADATLFQVCTACYLKRQPVKPIGRVYVEQLQPLHLANFWRDANQVAAVKTDFSDACQFGNRCWKGDDFDPILPFKFGPRFKDLRTVDRTSVNDIQQPLPRIATRVLLLPMKLELVPALVGVVLRLKARAQGPSTCSGYRALRRGVQVQLPFPRDEKHDTDNGRKRHDGDD